MRYAQRPLLVSATAGVLLGGCATDPLAPLGPVAPLTAGQVAARPAAPAGSPVHWGGVIVSSTNLADSTQIEVLSYPLDRSGRPDTTATAQGRFVVERPGYLETMDYGQGRLISVIGPVIEVRQSAIGEARYRYPVVSPQEMHLWRSAYYGSQPSVFFGFGIGVHAR